MESFFDDINDFNQRFPQEKVYLHFDNTSYFLEETIWFSAYIVRSDNLCPEPLSRVLYVELLSPEGSLLESHKYYIEEGRCHGEFHLDSLYLSGYYEIRAYTRYMLNFGEDAVFSRVFPVYNVVNDGQYLQRTIRDRDLSRRTRIRDIHYFDGWFLSHIFKPGKRMQEKYYFPAVEKRTAEERKSEVPLSEVFEEDATIPGSKNKIEVDFYPEGGTYIMGLKQRIAFSITDSDGKGIQTTVKICDNNDKTALTIDTDVFGNGSVSLMNDGQRRFLTFHHQGCKHRYKLPSPDPSGCALSVRETPDSVKVEVRLAESLTLTDTCFALAMSYRGHIYRFESTDGYKAGNILVSCALDSLEEGVHEAALFDVDGNTLAQRLFFVRHHHAENDSRITVNVMTDSLPSALSPFQHVTVPLNVSSADGKGVETSLSVAVRDEEFSELSYNDQDIYTNLLLSSEIKGFLPQVSYYFDKDTPVRRQSLDLLLLTRGLCHYTWKDMNKDMVPLWDQPIERNLMVDGKVYRYRDFRRPCLKNASLNFSAAMDSVEYYGRIRTNDLGRYAVQLRSFYGEGELYVTIRNSSELSDHIVTFNRWYSPRPRPFSFYEMNIPYSTDDDIHTEQYRILDSLLEVDLPEASITRRSFRRHVQHNYSLRHYNVTEELEYMLDVYQMPIEAYLRRPDSLVLCLMHRYNFPPCVFNTAIAEDYTSDTEMPEAKLYWQIRRYRRELPKMKEIVVRSEEEIRNEYRVPAAMLPANWTEDGYETGSRQMLPTGYKVPSYVHTDRPDCVAFFIPYDPDSEEAPMMPHTVGTRVSKIQGYSYSADFPLPDYRNIPLPDLPKDYRRTLYWDPDVRTDSEGNARIEFYNNSTCRHLQISVEGLTCDGQPLVYEK